MDLGNKNKDWKTSLAQHGSVKNTVTNSPIPESSESLSDFLPRRNHVSYFDNLVEVDRGRLVPHLRVHRRSRQNCDRILRMSRIRGYATQNSYRVCHRFRLTNRNDYFGVNFDHFWIKQYFWGSLGSLENWLEPKPHHHREI